jgi:hypothetical protein
VRARMCSGLCSERRRRMGEVGARWKGGDGLVDLDEVMDGM